MEIDQQEYDWIAEQSHSDTSPVGIDAKKTHILILAMLQKMNARLDSIEQRIETLQSP